MSGPFIYMPMRVRNLINMICSLMLGDTALRMDRTEKESFFMKMWIVLFIVLMAGFYAGTKAPM